MPEPGEEKLIECHYSNTDKVKRRPCEESIGNPHKEIDKRMLKICEKEQIKWEDSLLREVSTSVQT